MHFGDDEGYYFHMLDGAKRDQYETVANLLLQQVPLEQIGQVVGLAVSTLSEMKDRPEFQAIFQAKAAEFHAANKDIDDGWDLIEKQAVANVMENLTWNKNPDFSLRAAVLANKASRRTRVAQTQAIQAGAAGARVVINLQPTFIQKLQTMERKAVPDKTIDITPEPSANIPQKQVNVLLPSQVEEMLFPGAKKNINTVERAVEEIFADAGLADGDGSGTS